MIGYKKPLGKAMMGYKIPLSMSRIGSKMPLVMAPIMKQVNEALTKKVSGGLERSVLKR
jgi:hypothetical protein